jgi:chromosome segregation ATPase
VDEGIPPDRAAEDRVATLEKKLTTLRDALTREMQSVWAAEGRVYDMGKKLEQAREQLAALQRELDAQRARTESAERRAIEAEELAEHPAGMTPELAAVFRDAGELVERIVAESRRSAGEAPAPETASREEFAELAAWRDRVEPHVQPLREAVTDVQQEIEVVAALIREALEPINLALTTLGTKLDAFIQVAGDGSDEIVVDISGEHQVPSSPSR